MRNCSFYPLLAAALVLLLAGCATISAPAPAPASAPAAPPRPVPSAPQLSYFDQQRHDLAALLGVEMHQGDVEIDLPQANALVITLSTDATFIDSSAQLRPAAQDTLGKIAAILRRFDRTWLTITGYSDQADNPVQAQQLSEARAHQAAQYLAAQGIAASRIQAAGLGNQNPRASNRTEFGRALNRRIEITVRPAGAD